MKRLARATIAAVTILGLGVPGIVGAASNIGGTTGPNSTNIVKTKSSNSWNTDVHNNVGATLSTTQNAASGKASAKDNTSTGDVSTGDASNAKHVDATIAVDNSGSTPAADMSTGSDLGGTISGTTGPDSVNKIEESSKNTVKVKTTNTVTFTDVVSQTAKTGNASVTHNTTGGDASTGNAANTSTTTLDLSVTN